MRIQVLGCTVAALILASEARALASDDLTLTGAVGVTSDLRDRGLSLSDQDFAPTFSLTLDTATGLYGGVFAASALTTPSGNDTEVEMFVGYAFPVSGFVVDLSAEVDSFFGGDRQSFAEFKASVSRDFGLAFIKVGAAYAPSGRWFTPDQQSLYLRTDLEIPVPGMPDATIISRFGYDMREGRADVLDWGAGVSYFVGDVELSLMVENSGQSGAYGEQNVIGGIRLFF